MVPPPIGNFRFGVKGLTTFSSSAGVTASIFTKLPASGGSTNFLTVASAVAKVALPPGRTATVFGCVSLEEPPITWFFLNGDLTLFFLLTEALDFLPFFDFV